MDPASLIGIVLSLVALLVFMVMEGADPMSLIFLPAIILVIVATFGAAMTGQTMDDLKKMPGWFKMAVLPAKVPPASDQIQTLVRLAEKARKEGLLALEAQVKQIEDPFLKRGLQMGIDGTDPEQLRDVLEAEIAAKKAEDKVAAKFMNDDGRLRADHRHHRLHRRPHERHGEPRRPRGAGPDDRRGVRRHPVGRHGGQLLVPAHGRQDHCGSASCRPRRWSCSSRASPRSRPAPARAPSG